MPGEILAGIVLLSLYVIPGEPRNKCEGMLGKKKIPGKLLNNFQLSEEITKLR